MYDWADWWSSAHYGSTESLPGRSALRPREKGLSPEAVSELRMATDLALCATKQAAALLAIHARYGGNGETPVRDQGVR